MIYHNWLEIDLGKIKSNFRALRNYIKPETKIMAVVKSDAYGHGLEETAKALEFAGADCFAVESIDEGVRLRKAKIEKPVLVLGFAGFGDYITAITNDLDLTVWDRDMVRQLSKAAIEIKKPANVYIKLNTGMNRYGLEKSEIVEFAVFLKRQPKINTVGVYSHFANAEGREKSLTFKQLGTFQESKDMLEKAGFSNLTFHIANSAATLSMTSTHFDMVRLGITLYGLSPTPELGTFFDLTPALSWKTKIAQIRKIPGGENVGYGNDTKVNSPSYIATVPVGYADGYDRKLSNIAKVLVGGKRVPVIGKVCMNAMMLDVSAVENIKIGDEVVLIGKQENENITAGELAGYLETINYEVVTRINPMIPRVYIK